MSTTMSATDKPVPDDRADGYGDFRTALFTKSLLPPETPLFTTAAEGLFDLFLAGLPADRRQHYTCRACRTFVDRFGGLVTIDDVGNLTPALWPEQSNDFFRPAVEAVCRVVSASKVDGVFVSSNDMLGQPVTGAWTHLHALNVRQFKGKLKNAHQRAAE